jgi:3'(2'), 5'-bisphosphate nucleotidase
VEHSSVDIVQEINRIIKSAGQIVAEKYHAADSSFQTKVDGSPVTLADQASHDFLVSQLCSVINVPIVSEEGAEATWKTAERYWLIDPLDGTKGFLKRTGEFSINIALMEGVSPVLGFISQPVSGDIYWAAKGKGAFKNGAAISNRSERSQLIALTSASHLKDSDLELLKSHNVGKHISMGSALKFCYLAEGIADLYIRFGPTMFWDTAAGQIIAEEAGCIMQDLTTRKKKVYPLGASFTNGPFVAMRSDIDLGI